jgi:hypothetical protein
LDYSEFNCIVFVSKPSLGLAHQHLEIAIFQATGRSRVRGVAQTVHADWPANSSAAMQHRRSTSMIGAVFAGKSLMIKFKLSV